MISDKIQLTIKLLQFMTKCKIFTISAIFRKKIQRI